MREPAPVSRRGGAAPQVTLERFASLQFLDTVAMIAALVAVSRSDCQPLRSAIPGRSLGKSFVLEFLDRNALQYHYARMNNEGRESAERSHRQDEAGPDAPWRNGNVNAYRELMRLLIDEVMRADKGNAVSAEEPKALLQPRLNEDRLGEFLADLEFVFRKRFEAAGKKLAVGSGNLTGDTRIELDKGMVTEILENLICNALEHGGKTTRVSAASRGKELEITVSDDGPGIEDQAILALLGRGSTVIVPSRPTSSTHGLGLSIAKLLAQAHGGTLEYEKQSIRFPWPSNLVLVLPGVIKEDEVG